MLRDQGRARRGEKQTPYLPSRFPLLGRGLREGVGSSSETAWQVQSCKEMGKGALSTKKKQRYRVKAKKQSNKSLNGPARYLRGAFWGRAFGCPSPLPIGHTKARCFTVLRGRSGELPTGVGGVFNALVVLKALRKSSKVTSPCVPDPRGNAWAVLSFQHRDRLLFNNPRIKTQQIIGVMIRASLEGKSEF